MPDPNAITGRPPLQQRRVTRRLRRWIVDGKLAPGSRLPSQQELIRRFRVSGVTIQRTIADLARDGFLVTKPRRGVFVAGGLPHFTNYVLVIPGRPGTGQGESQFWLALQREAEALNALGDRKLAVVSHWDYQQERDQRLATQLLRDVRDHRVAGLILGAVTAQIAPTPLWTEPNIPRAVLSPGPITNYPCVYPDVASFLTRALDHLRSAGCRRVSVIGLPGWQRAHPRFAAQCRQRGLAPADPAALAVVPDQGEGVAQCVALLWRGPRSTRPDGLIIADDNLVPQATEGVAAARLRRAGPRTIVAHTNFPWPTPSAVPVTRLGYSARWILEQCIALIERQRNHQPAPALTLAPAIFEAES